MRNAIQPKLNKTQPLLVPDLSMHTEYSRLSCCVALPLGKKRLLTTVTICTQLKPLCALTALEDVLITAWADIDITEK